MIEMFGVGEARSVKSVLKKFSDLEVLVQILLTMKDNG